MTEIVLKIIEVVLTAVVLPVAIYYLNKLGTYLKTKLASDKAQTAIDRAEEMIQTVVTSTTQTYVESLKASKSFDIEAQKTAFNKSFITVRDLLTDEAENAISAQYGNIDVWIENQIESAVKKTK